MKFIGITLYFMLATGLTLLSGYDTSSSGVETSAGMRADLVRYRLDPARSKFMVNADRTGLAWYKGHSHRIAVRDFSGTAAISIDAVNPASLEMTIRAASLEETDPVFTQPQKDIINKELETIVLETDKYPDITFKSTEVRGSLKNGAFDLRIGGDITLHGVTRHIVIPATVTVQGSEMHAHGVFELDRAKFNVKATEAFHGLVRIKNTLKFTFDIVGQRD